MTLIKSISGIRGTIGGRPGDNLTPLDIVKFTTAYVRFLGERKQGRLRIVVGRDARLSGEMVGDLIEGALLGCGADVVNVGLCTTPGVELAVTAHEADGGIIITASHNPRQWNALKLLDADGEFLSDAEGKRVLELAERSDFEFPEVDALGHVLSRESFNDEHIRRVLALPLVDVDAVEKDEALTVVLDNGDMRIDDEDFTVIGNTHARFAYGLKVTLTWRNFELFAYMSAQTGATKDYRSDAYYAVYGPNAKYPVHLIGRWAYDPSLGIDTRATATYPRLTASSSGTTHNYGKTSTFWLARQNYFSIPAVQLSYHLGDKLMKTLRLKDVTIYARATDILLLSPSRDRMILNVGSEFQYAWVHLGVKLKF